MDGRRGAGPGGGVLLPGGVFGCKEGWDCGDLGGPIGRHQFVIDVPHWLLKGGGSDTDRRDIQTGNRPTKSKAPLQLGSVGIGDVGHHRRDGGIGWPVRPEQNRPRPDADHTGDRPDFPRDRRFVFGQR